MEVEYGGNKVEVETGVNKVEVEYCGKKGKWNSGKKVEGK